MKFNKRLLSFFLAVLMVVSTFGDSVYAITENAKANSTNKKTEIEGKVEGDKEVFTFDLSEFKSKESVAPMTAKAMPARAPRRAPVQWDTQVNITTIGLNGKAFDWTALPNKEFKLIAKWETTDGQKHEKIFATITEAKTYYENVGWPVDGTMVGNASVVTNYNGNIEVRVAITSGSATGGSAKLTFDITLTELAEPRVNIEYIDPYGRPITDQADLPSDADTMPKVTAEELSDVAIELPKTKGQINMRDSGDIDDDELNTAENGLTYKVDGKEDEAKVTIGGKEYKLDISQPNAKEIATIKMVYQKDVVIPPTKDDGNPVDPAEGYVRLTFDANENKVDGVIGKHNAGDYAGQQKSYIDVKEGLDYTNANLQAAIKALATTGTKVVNGETKTYTQDAENPWTPKVPADATKVAIATYNAQYKKSAAEQVEELGGLNPKTIKVWKADTIDWKKGVEAAVENNSAAVVELLKAATVTDITVPERNSNEAGKFVGKLKISFDDGSSLEVDKQMLIVSEHIVTLNPNDPDVPKEEELPDDKIEVRFLASTGVQAINTTGKTYVKPGTAFEDKDFPQEKDITFDTGYKGPVTWTPKDKTVTTTSPAYLKRQGYFRFKASATKNTTADEVKALGGLKGVDFAEFVGATLDWKKGVAPADGVKDTDKATIEKAIQEATVEDTTAQKRTTDAKGTFPGTLKVTFKDGSVYVANEQGATEEEKTNIEQKLYVYDKGDKKPDDENQPVPAGTIYVAFDRDEKSIKETGFEAKEKLMYAEGDVVPAEKFPDAKAADGFKAVVWTPEKTTAVSTTNAAYDAQTKTFTFKASATKNTTADEVKALGGLKGVDFAE
ncbi:hypothetical protein, partial [Peptoniphilus senegalensis]